MNILWIRGAGKWRFERKSLQPAQKYPVLGVPDGLAAMSTVTSLAPGTDHVRLMPFPHTVSTRLLFWSQCSLPLPDTYIRHTSFHVAGGPGPANIWTRCNHLLDQVPFRPLDQVQSLWTTGIPGAHPVDQVHGIKIHPGHIYLTPRPKTLWTRSTGC